MMSRKTSISQMIIKGAAYKIKRFFHKTFRNFRSFISKEYEKLPKTPTPKPIFSVSNKINSSLQDLDNFYQGFCEHWDSMDEVKKINKHLPPKVQRKADEQCSKSSMSTADCSGLDDLYEDIETRSKIGRKQGKNSDLSVHALSQKMKELEMMDVKDMDQVLDVEEVLHYYSRLTCPAYVEIVDKFFMDIYAELNVPEQSRRGKSLVRKLSSSSVPTASLDSLKL
ncbi:uncharacterized protein LOC127254802 [Andrographis paniculata]|uniref:uncharacterized protein LOC127254802 n=1 Tax=Andrographis paniculata TaxID=175694 RepID=UPI0021E800B5|nr:uncharacterized protein LOC127254802 [Andrographis paniculata]XP_051136040.1 uncharacterized protein LOC127254802 [Andrographis paniculata]